MSIPPWGPPPWEPTPDRPPVLRTAVRLPERVTVPLTAAETADRAAALAEADRLMAESEAIQVGTIADAVRAIELSGRAIAIRAEIEHDNWVRAVRHQDGSEWDELRAVAVAAGLKGKERLAVGAIAAGAGSVSLDALAGLCKWRGDRDAGWKDTAKRVNRKLARYGWRVRRQDNRAVAEKIPAER